MSETSRPTRIGVRRGVTVPKGRFENERIELWAEADLPIGITLQQGLEDIYATVDLLVASKKSALLAGKASSEVSQLNLDPKELEKLEWHEYRPGHRAAWAFTDRVPKALVEKLDQEGKHVVIGEFRYRFSGPEENPKLFISRVPSKEQ